MKPYQIIQKLESDNSRLFKESVILQVAESQFDEFFEGLKYCLDALTTFGVKQIPTSSIDGPGIAWDDFEGLLIQLRDRTITGNAARDAIQTMMELSLMDEWNYWYKRILDKDLKCGVSEKTVNNVVKKKFSNYIIPVFSVQLAHDSANHESKVKGKKLIDVKYDGCLSEDWVVEFDDGRIVKIKEVVDNQLSGKIKSYNIETNEIEFNEILGWMCNGENPDITEYEWFEIVLEDGRILPPITGNHLIFIPQDKCYKRVDLLTENDIILLDQ